MIGFHESYDGVYFLDKMVTLISAVQAVQHRHSLHSFLLFTPIASSICIPWRYPIISGEVRELKNSNQWTSRCPDMTASNRNCLRYLLLWSQIWRAKARQVVLFCEFNLSFPALLQGLKLSLLQKKNNILFNPIDSFFLRLSQKFNSSRNFPWRRRRP